MSKRRRVDYALTGGSGDVNPQFYSGEGGTGEESNYAATSAYISPVSRGLPAPRGKAVVMEVLKIFVDLPDYEALTSTAVANRARFISFSTRDLGAGFVKLSDPTVFAKYADEQVYAFTAAGTVCSFQPSTISLDLTDGAGHGILIATDYIYVQYNTTQFGAANVPFYWKILYRFKTVALTEYIGIVQSQS
ncbi:unnamed protein product [marine sediment metagenome]|uniref:Uncharacterized protein n=1 Tax=marine sediment metagenome TaxID=412755 RepID=X1FH46_9ZZZZ